MSISGFTSRIKSVTIAFFTILSITLIHQKERAMIRFLLFTLFAWSVSFFASAENILKIDIMTQNGGGTVLIELLPEAAPNHVERIKTLVSEGKYDGVAFHRVIAGFMAQTGDVEYANKKNFNSSLAGTGGSAYPDLKAEFSTISFKTGVVGMARSRSVDSANSQFFIMTADNAGLDGQYTVFGRVKEGLGLVKSLKRGSRAANGRVDNPDYIVKASII